jgi:hypothetical protein
MKLRHRIAAICSASVLAATALVFTAPSASAVACGDAESEWSGLLASTWTVEAYIDSVDYDTVLVLTNLGNTTVLLNVDTLATYNGSYAHIGANNELDFSATTPVLGNPFDRLTFQLISTACNGANVDAAAGNIVRQDEGVVGVAYATRVV